MRRAPEGDLPEARIVSDSEEPVRTAPRQVVDPLRWIRRMIFLAVLFGGWVFIGWQNRFHFTAPVVFVCLGYLAVVATVFNLWRTGAAAVSAEHEGEEAWARPAGARGELEKEKRTLLKAIKEAEFDHEMGKLSKVDADQLVQTYRARAIDVIKELDRLEVGQADSVRARIDREVKARLALQDKKAPGKKGKKSGKPDKEDGKPAVAASDAKVSTSAEDESDAVAASANEAEASKGDSGDHNKDVSP
jgi:hypothetical protein